MIRYYRAPGLRTASAETAASAARIEARGYTRCAPEHHRIVWRARDAARYAELRAAALWHGLRAREVGMLVWKGRP